MSGEVEGLAVRVVDAVKVEDTGLAERLERNTQAVERVDEAEKIQNRATDEERLKREGKEVLYEFAQEYVTIKNVLDIQENPVYRAAFEEWNRQLKVYRVKLVDKESEKTELNNQVYNIVGFFSVFQGVVLTAVSQVSSGSGEKCRKTWVPVLLSVIAALAAIFALYRKYHLLHLLESELNKDRARIDKLQRGVDDLLEQGKRFRFYTNRDQSCRKLKGASEDSSSVSHNGVLVSVVLFTGVFVLSYFVFLCDKLLI